MIKNFFTVAIRSFFRQKLFSVINAIGLASGLTCALLIYLWVNDELQKDKFHDDPERIFQIVSNLRMNDGEILTWPITPGPLAEDIREAVPEVELAARTQEAGSILFQNGDKGFLERGIYADPEFFQIFSFRIVAGRPSADRLDVSSISISQALARKLFGSDDAVGKTVKVNRQRDYTIAAVFEDVPAASSMKFDYVLPFEVFKKNRGNGFNWGNFDHPLYIRLLDAAKANDVMNRINERRAKAAGTDGNSTQFYLQPFTEYYLNSLYENGVPVGGRIKYVRIFSVVAIFILVIACINFMNMATARAANRAKEVGIRKVVGAQRKSLVLQFITESMLMTTAAMLIALGITFVLLPLFNQLVAKQIVISFADPMFPAMIVAIIIFTGLLAGSYPAFFLSSYEPAQVLKGATSRYFSGSGLRKTLVVFQFVLTVILIASSLVVYRQIEFIRTKNLGYNREAIMSFPLRGELWKQFENFKNELQGYPEIKSISKADQSIVQVNNQNSSVTWPGQPANSQQFFRTVAVDFGFLETMGVELKEGRTFAREFVDTAAFVVSERAVEVMGLTDPVGTRITQWGIPGTIVGVVGDFHSRSMHEAIDPIIFLCRPEWAGWVFVKLDPDKTQSAIATIEKIYKKYNAEYPFTFSFVDDDFDKLYNSEKVTGSLAIGFTIMAVIISALGLLGLAAYSVEKRRKEISIRKTLGASIASIVALMSREFIRISLVSAFIGCPLAYLMMKRFLEGYAYHTELQWETFAITAVMITIVAMVTVIIQVTRAAIENPVDALRNE